jgi:hypothetical protein
MRRKLERYLLILICALALAAALPRTLLPGQDQQEQEKTEKEKQQSAKKKKGGFFSGLKAITGESSEQQEATRTAGSKTVGEGQQIGDTTPSSADRAQVNAMERYTVPQADLKKFAEDGQLKPEQ